MEVLVIFKKIKNQLDRKTKYFKNIKKIPNFLIS